MATNAELSLSLLIKESTIATRELSKLEEQLKKTTKVGEQFADKVNDAKKSLNDYVKGMQLSRKASASFAKDTNASGKAFNGLIKDLDGAGKTFTRLSTRLVKSGKSVTGFNTQVNDSFASLSLRSASASQQLSVLEQKFKKNVRAGNDFNKALTSSQGAALTKGNNKSGKFNKRSGASGGALRAVAAPVTAVAGAAVAVGEQVVEVSKQFETLEARIATVASSSQKSKEIFANLKDMAEATPHSIEQTSNAFVALYNNGLTPTQNAMTAYGDIASTLGMSIEEVSDSVINATSNQAKVQQDAFANLGVTAVKNGELLTLTYNGVTTNIKDNSENIQAYLTELGQNNFAGAMAKEMDTMGGRIERFGSEWDELFLNIGNAGVGDVIKDSISLATSALDEFNSMLASGELAGHLGAIAKAYNLDAVAEAFSSTFDGMGADVEQALDFIGKAMLHLPANGQMLVDMLQVHLKQLPAHAQLYGAQFKAYLVEQLDMLLGKAGIIGSELLDKLNPFDGDTFNYDAATDAFEAQAQARARASEDLFTAQERAIAKSKASSFELIRKERDKSIAAVEAEIDKAKELRSEYDKANTERQKTFKNASTNTQLGLKPAAIGTSEGAASSGLDKVNISTQSNDSSNELSQQQTQLQESCERQLQTVTDAENLQTQTQLALIKERNGKILELERQKNSQLADEASGFMSNLQNLGNTLNADLTNPENVEASVQAMVEAYESGKTLIDELFYESDDEGESAQSGEDEVAALEAQNETKVAATQALAEQQAQIEVEQTKQKSKAMADIEREQQSQRLSQASDFFGGVASVAAAFGGKQSKAAKAAAIAQTTIKTYESATNAYASLAGIPYVGPALGIAAAAAAVAAGMANVQAIKSTNYSGAYDHGGLIPAGKIGLVGEYGPELIAGPVNVTSRRTTAGLNTSSTSAEQAPQNIDKSVKFNYVINANDSDAVAQVMKRERAKIMQDVRYAMESGEWD
ncbi:hypothetical protein [Pseudoalteromonas sp. MMG022]|uniref:hypothetical protein n=1 Tax=Pseudoalteromonas sp. MMG022 TaxID=2909978 RepID=UPI001F172D7B|nr:hypothetical protein [Pseudoalteromonas sp. MMG022]MCF6435210.1 hypothetical protein [Pseudoalteromonas sp. MMG022]